MKLIIAILLFVLIFSKNVFAGPKVSILDSPTQVNKNEEFIVTFNVVNDLLSSDSYYIKGRIGSSSASMNQGETFNLTSSSWLSDTASWSTFPTIAFSNDTIATSTVTLRTKSTVFTGNNLLTIRLNRNSTSYDSPSDALLVFEPLTPTPSLTSIPSSTATPTSTTDPALTVTPTAAPTTTPSSYQNMYISEVMANPSSGDHEWVELFNNNDYSVSLIDWFIDDVENGGSSSKLFSLEIPAKNYGIIEFSSSIFNNTGDSVRLLDFNKNLKDDFEYGKTEQGKTLGRTSLESDDFCLQEPSYNSVNNPCINPTPTITSISPTANTISAKTSTVKSTFSNKSVSINQLIDTKKIIVPIEMKGSGQVLGMSNELIINSYNNKSLINLLTVLSFSYSLLVIVSVLIKSKVLKKYALAS